MWRVEKSLEECLSARYYVVRGYEVGRLCKEMWKNKLGAGDFTSLQDAQDQANILNAKATGETA